MGNSLFRNRFWYYKTVYDDYMAREFRYSFAIASFVFLPHYWWGVHMNREIEVNQSHLNYHTDYEPRRNRLMHSMIFEEFEIILEDWKKLENEYKENQEAMLKEVPN